MKLYYLLETGDEILIGDELLTKTMLRREWIKAVNSGVICTEELIVR
jgi:hypothetical protein